MLQNHPDRRGGGCDIVFYDDRFVAVARAHPGVVDLAVLEIGIPDRPVIAAGNAVVGDNSVPSAVCKFDFQPGQQLALIAEAVVLTKKAKLSHVPAVGQGKHQRVVLSEQPGYVVGLIIQPLGILRGAGGQDAGQALCVEGRGVSAAGRGVEPGALDFSVGGKVLLEILGRQPLLSGSSAGGDPFGVPLRDGQTHFKPALRPFAGLVVFIPDPELPVHPLAGCGRLRKDCVHLRGPDLTAVPVLGYDLPGGLREAALAVPGKAKTLIVNTQGRDTVVEL